MAIRGERAQRLLELLADGVPELPDGVSLEVGPGWGLKARCVTGGVAGAMSPFGYGTPIPFVPKTFDLKLAATQALQSIQDCVAQVAGRPWPSAGSKVVAHTIDGVVEVLFVGPSAPAISVAAIRLADLE